MGILFSIETIFVISVILLLISIHSLILCVIDFNQIGDFFTLIILFYGLYIIYVRSYNSIDIFNGK